MVSTRPGAFAKQAVQQHRLIPSAVIKPMRFKHDGVNSTTNNKKLPKTGEQGDANLRLTGVTSLALLGLVTLLGLGERKRH